MNSLVTVTAIDVNKTSLIITIQAKNGTPEPDIYDCGVDLEVLLKAIREENPALYMRGVTTDMIVEYT